MKRSRIENNDLTYNIRINGRIYAAFIREQPAKDLVISLAAAHPEYKVELSTQDGITYRTIKNNEHH